MKVKMAAVARTGIESGTSTFSLDAYFRGWHGLRIGFDTFFLNSLMISVLSIIGNLATCSLAAFAFARRCAPAIAAPRP